MRKPGQQILSAVLIGLLCFEAIFRIPLLIAPVSATELPRHEDLVSILVESSVYDAIGGEIQDYASRIQEKLPDTRALIFPVDKDTHPYAINLLNERLYFSGQPDRSKSVTQKLVGTILIGEIPLPVVTKNDTSFVSIFPYVDFDEPHFYFDTDSNQFQYVSEPRDKPEADIWHSLIRPNTGDFDTDVDEIEKFFERVYAFDSGEGIYANVYDDPQVLYLDSYREAQSIGRGRWEAYRQLTLAYQQNIAYHWYSRPFAQFLTESYQRILENEGDYESPDFQGWESTGEEDDFLDNVGDITTKRIVDEMIPSFIDVINEKYLGEIAKYVHNTGRYYNGRSDVRMDTLPEIITKKDLAAKELLKQVNLLLENEVDTLVENKLARDIPVLTRENVSQTITEQESYRDSDGNTRYRSVQRTYNFVYDNYMYGQKVSSITDASQCSITRGSEYRQGESYIVEANQGYDPQKASGNSALLARDINAGIVCSSNDATATKAYWGGNSIFNASFVDAQPVLGTHVYDYFVQPIFDINGAKLIEDGSSLRVNQPSDCFVNHMIMRPYLHQGVEKQYYWPTETKGSRYTCQTGLSGNIPAPFSLAVTKSSSLRFEDVVSKCDVTTGTISLLGRTGQTQTTCDGSDRSLTFKRIPSVIYHTSPTDTEYGSQLTAISVPNLPIDSTRYVSFIGLTGSQESYDYPNLFSLDFGADETQSDIEARLRSYLSGYSRDLNTLITKVDPRGLDSNSRTLALELSNIGNLGSYPDADIDFGSLLESNAQIYAQLIDALDWLRLDSLPEKYDRALSGALDYQGTDVEQLMDPSQKEFYEIAYLAGLGNAQNMFIDMFPEANLGPSSDVVSALAEQVDAQDAIRDALSEYRTLLQAVTGTSSGSDSGTGGVSEFALTQEEQQALTQGGEDSAEQSGCAPEGSVVIWEWPAAIECWLSEELDIKWEAAELDLDTSVFDDYVNSLEGSFGDFIDDFSTIFGKSGSVVSPLIFQSSSSSSSTSPVVERSTLSYSDTNDNGVADVYEQSSSYDLLIQGDGSVYNHGDGGNLTIQVVDGEGTLVDDSISQVILETIRVDDLDGDVTTTYQESTTSDWDTFSSDYLDHLDTPVYLSRGENTTLFTTGHHDANVYLRAHMVDDDGSIIMSSGLYRVRIREQLFQVVSEAVDGAGAFTVSSTYTVGNEDGISFRFVPRTDDADWRAPMSLQVVNTLDGSTVYAQSNVGLDDDSYYMHFDTHEDLLTTAGQFTFIFTDASDQIVSDTMTFLPEVPASVQLIGNKVLVKEASNILLLELRDRYGNLAYGTQGSLTITADQDLDMSASGTASIADDTLEVDTISGNMALEVVPSTSGELRFTFDVAIEGHDSIQSSSDHTVVDGVVFKMLGEDQDYVVGGERHDISILATDNAGKVLSDFDVILPITADSRYATVSSPVTITNGRGTLSLYTGTKTTDDLSIISLLQGPFEITGNSITIRSGEPIGLKISSDTSEFISSIPGQTRLQVSLYDTYGNDYDGDATYPVTLSNLDPQLLDLANLNLQVGAAGVSGITASHKQKGGIAYVLASLGGLDTQDDFIATSDALIITIHHALYKGNLQDLNLNTLKTDLLGGAYGDVNSSDYLGGVFLYDTANSRNLAVTSLVDDPYIRDRWFRLEPTGQMTVDTQYGLLTPSIDATIENGKIDIQVRESLTDALIAQISPRFTTDDFEYFGCSADTIISGGCLELPASNYAFVAAYDGMSVSADDDGLYVTDGSKEMFTLHADGTISGEVDRLEWSTTSTRSALSLSMYAGDSFVGLLEIAYGAGAQLIESDATIPESTGLYMSTSSDALAKASYTGYSTQGPVAYDVISSDALTQVLLDENMIGGGNGAGYTQYLNSDGLGWKQDDMDLLDFAAGNASASSLQTYQDYLTVHLGDPLVMLDTKRNYTHGFDRTVGEPIYVSDKPIHDIVYRDINADNTGDLVIFHDDGTIALRMSPGDENHDVGDIAQILDMDEDKTGIGDFYGDDYPDIAFVTDNGTLQILSNEAGVYLREDPIYDVQLSFGPIMHMKVFDMDDDGLDDIVVVDRFGSLYILYGDESEIFTVQFIENAFSISIDDLASDSYFTGSVHYEGAGGIGEGTLATQDAVIASVIYDIVDTSGTGSDAASYVPTSLGDEVSSAYDVDIFGFFRMDDSGAAKQSQIDSAYQALQQEYPDSITVVGPTKSATDIATYFIKAPFLPEALSITKQFVAENPDEVNFGDEVQVVLTVKNVSDERITNLQILDANPSILEFSDDYSYEQQIGDFAATTESYTLASESPVTPLFDLTDITLDPGDIVTLTYILDVTEFEYGDLQVGYLEKSDDPNDGRLLDSEEVRTIDPDLVAQFEENPDLTLSESEFVGIENYGDIVFYPDVNCGGQYFLWRSHNETSRTYHKTFRGFVDGASRLSENGTDPSLTSDSSGEICVAQDGSTGDDSSSSSENVTHTTFEDGLSWDYRLGENPSLGDRDVYMVDLFTMSASQIATFKDADKKVVCYINAGALQSGSHGQDLTDADTVEGGEDFQQEWGEKFLDIRSEHVRDVMLERLDLAASKGCDGIEPDNIDAYDNDTELTEEDTIDYLEFLSDAAHSRGLSIGLKNGADLAQQLEPTVDFAIAEECHTYNECDSYDAFTDADKAVFSVEYEGSCSSSPTGFSNIMCQEELVSQCELCSGGSSTSQTFSSSQIFSSSEHSSSNTSALSEQILASTDSSLDIASAFDEESERDDLLSAYNTDSDGDTIPDRDDDSYGSFLEIEGNTITIGENIGNYVEEINQLLSEVISGLSCGFGDAGCISMPINWTANMPGNTLTFMGYAIKQLNQPPYACYKDVRCGYPVFAYPTGEDEEDTWPEESYGAGGAFDYESDSEDEEGSSSGEQSNGLNDSPDANGSVTAKEAPKFTGGLGISEFRLFIGATLTGAVAEAICLGPNTEENASINLPGLFPINFTGNCIFATQPLIQCEDDGSEVEPDDFDFEIEPEIDSPLACIDDGLLAGSENSLLGSSGSSSGNDSCGDPIDESVTFSLQTEVSTLITSTGTTASDAQDQILTTLSENPEAVTSSFTGGSSYSPVSVNSSLADPIDRLNGESGIGLTAGSSGSAVSIAIGLGESGLVFKGFDTITNININSIKAFPNFIMDWLARQVDEIVMSLADLPDVQVVLPDFGGISDYGWQNVLGGVKGAYQDGVNSVKQSQTKSSCSGGSCTRSSSASVEGIYDHIAQGIVGSAYAASGDGNFLQNLGGTAQNVSNKVTNSGFVKGVQQQYGGLQSAIEAINSLPIINLQGQSVGVQLPWMGKEELQSWLTRNKAILQSWKDISGLVDVSRVISSIEANIAIVESYMTLPEKIQEYLHWKEKYMYEILANVKAVQDLMGGWLYNNGLRFKSWVEAFILVTRLWELWQAILDVFLNYDLECGVCRNERWNLQHWLWIIIGAIIPDIPVIQMPRWPDIGLDFSNIDLNLNIAYPNLNFGVYPVTLPDAPNMNITGLSVPAMPLFPQLPNLPALPDIPVINLPTLPNLPPAPKIPELSSAIEVVLDIFKLVTLIQCLYRKVPLSPEWYLGTKVAHKTERQGYLPFDFLDIKIPTPQIEFIDKINIATNIGLSYDTSFLVDSLREALGPLSGIQRNFSRIGDGVPSQINLDLNGISMGNDKLDQLVAALEELRDIRGNLVDVNGAYAHLDQLVANLQEDAGGLSPALVARIIELTSRPDLTPVDGYLAQLKSDQEDRFAGISGALRDQIADAQDKLDQLSGVIYGDKDLFDVPFLNQDTPTDIIQTSYTSTPIDTQIPKQLASAHTAINDLIAPSGMLLSVITGDENSVTTQQTSSTSTDTQTQQEAEGIYILNKYGRTQRLTDYTTGLDVTATVMADVDGDDDIDILYARGNTVYLKRHQANAPIRNHITDRPRIYDQEDIYTDFINDQMIDVFGVSPLSRFLDSRSNTPNYISGKVLDDARRSHVRVFADQNLFSPMLLPEDTQYQLTYDIMDRDGYYPNRVGQLRNMLAREIPAYIQDAGGAARVYGYTKKMTLSKNNRYIDHENDEGGQFDEPIRVRPQQRVFTGKSDALLQLTWSDGTSERLRLPSHRELVFEEEVDLTVLSGDLILMSLTRELQILRASDLIDYPIDPGTHIQLLAGSEISLGFDDDSELDLIEGQEWELVSATEDIPWISFRAEVENGFYHARIQDVFSQEKPRMLRQTLFSPQDAADVYGIIADVPNEIPVPALVTTTLDFGVYAGLESVDEVIVQVEDEADDDLISPVSDTIYETGPFETLDLVPIRITFVDDAGNVSSYESALAPYAPSIDIQDATYTGDTVVITGHSDTTDTSMPAQMYYYDSYSPRPLVDTKLLFDATGDYRMSISQGETYFTLMQGDTQVLRIAKSTGHIYDIDEDYTVNFQKATSSRPSAFVVENSEGTTVYSWSYSLHSPVFAQIAEGRDMSSLATGIYLTSDHVRLIKASSQDPSIPDGAYVIDAYGKPIIAIDARGQIYTLDTDAVLEYREGEYGNTIRFASSEGVAQITIIMGAGVVAGL